MLNYEAIIYRIKKVIDDHDLNAASFAEKIGVQRSGISHILSGRNKPSLEFLSKIHTTFNEVEYDWLLLGKTQHTEKLPTTLFDSPEIKSVEKVPEIKITSRTNSEHTAPIKEIIYIYEDDSFKVIQRKS